MPVHPPSAILTHLNTRMPFELYCSGWHSPRGFVDTHRFSVDFAASSLVLVSAIGKNGLALHGPLQMRENGGAFPYMGYSPDGYPANAGRLLFAGDGRKGLILQQLGESPVSEVHKRLAISLLPASHDSIEHGDLAVGDPDRQIVLEVRLYLSREFSRRTVYKFRVLLDDD